MSLIHHITCVWPPEIVDIVLNNWLVNTTGNPNSFLECDLLQEHLNYWIKNFYRAHGTNAPWEWLEMLAPCVVVLRDLTRSLNGLLGADLGTKHKSPDHAKDLQTLINSLQQHEVHTLQRGRIISEEDGGPVTDIVSAGLIALTDATSNPLDEYNAAFGRLQARCRLPVLVPTTVAPPPPSPPSSSATDAAVTEETTAPPPTDAVIGAVEEVIPEVDGPEEDQGEEPVESENEATLTLDMEGDVELNMDEMGWVSEEPESDGSDDEMSEEEDELTTLD
ncbi:hypothetical protein FB45DRAFT_1055847 [Roridomyces roridus]|uniref:DUF6589 domain-containing protein n=1 Tax=Roridomyces roridus TaxID=1738132 RepID=A0AAD7C165_9AGAR|nr:hypothetical protein FB45DRAFT_1055847 [Roridomyces roridus]